MAKTRSLSGGFLFCLLCLSCPAFATPSWLSDWGPLSLNNIEFSAAGGPNWAHTSSTQLVVSPYETDSVLVSNVSNNLLWKVGFGSHFFVNQLQERTFLNDFLVELN